eukprot:gene27569-9945_t
MRRDGFQPYFNLDDLSVQEEGRIVEETRAFMTANRAEYQAEQREAEPQLEKMQQQWQYYTEFLAAAPPRSGAQPAPTSERRNAYFLYGKAGRGKTFDSCELNSTIDESDERAKLLRACDLTAPFRDRDDPAYSAWVDTVGVGAAGEQ